MLPTLGVLVLDTAFLRFPGDVGHPESFTAPVVFETMDGLGAEAAVERPHKAHLAIVEAAVRRAIARGARLLTTSCGFLGLHQAELERRLPVPILTGALAAASGLSGGDAAALGILTFDAASLTPAHLAAAGLPPANSDEGPAVEGLEPEGVFRRAILGRLLPGGPEDGLEARSREAVAAARRLVTRRPGVKHILCECGNLPPHRAAIAAAAGRPVHDVVTIVERMRREIS